MTARLSHSFARAKTFQGKVQQQRTLLSKQTKDRFDKVKQEGKKVMDEDALLDLHQYDMAQRLRNLQHLMKVKFISLGRLIATSEVSQFKGNDHHHSIGMVRFHTNRGQLRIGVVEVEECELPKDLRGPPIGSRVLVRNFIEEGQSSTCSLLNVIIKCVNHLW